MNVRHLARAVKLHADAFPYEEPEELTHFAVAQVRARMTRRGRVGYALRLVFVALTGRRPW